MINQIKKWFHFYFLKKELKFHKAQRQLLNINDAKEIGIIFDATDVDQTAIINQFADSLKGLKKKIYMFGYYNIPKPAINFNFPYFNKANLNWYLEPSGILVEEFIDRKFDILINVSIKENLPLEYIAAFSQASYRVGLYDPNKMYCYDLMIDLKGNKTLQKYIDQVKHYLHIL